MAQLPTTGIIDADGHVLEPADLWDHYLEGCLLYTSDAADE